MQARDLCITKRQCAYLHMLVTLNHLSDPEYRALLREAAGVDSSKSLRRSDFNNVLALLEERGYVVDRPRLAPADLRDRPGYATAKQLRYLNGLAAEVFGPNVEQAFRRWLEHYAHVSHPRFLTAQKVHGALNGLKAMQQRKEGK